MGSIYLMTYTDLNFKLLSLETSDFEIIKTVEILHTLSLVLLFFKS